MPGSGTQPAGRPEGPEQDRVEVPGRGRLAGRARTVWLLGGHPAHPLPPPGVLQAAQAGADAAGDINWLVSVDSSCAPTTTRPGPEKRGGQSIRPVPGRPRTRPEHVIGDKGYSSKAIWAWLRRRDIGHTIPERADQIRNRQEHGSRGGRPPAFDQQTYKRRNVVERCFNHLKQWRGIATGYEKTAESYQAAVTLASLLMWA